MIVKPLEPALYLNTGSKMNISILKLRILLLAVLTLSGYGPY